MRKPIKTKDLCAKCVWGLNHKCVNTDCDACERMNAKTNICKCISAPYGVECMDFEPYEITEDEE